MLKCEIKLRHEYSPANLLDISRVSFYKNTSEMLLLDKAFLRK